MGIKNYYLKLMKIGNILIYTLFILLLQCNYMRIQYNQIKKLENALNNN